MFKVKQTRLVAVASLFILLVFVLYRSSGSDTSTNSVAQVVTTNNIIDSQNDDKKDDAINQKILLSENNVDEADEGKPEVSEDKPFDPAQSFLEIRTLAPMTIFSKSYCPFSKRLKELLKDNYQITPEPQIVELDKHSNGRELQTYIGEVTGRSTVPNVIVGATTESRGGCDDLVKLHESGELLSLLAEWGGKKMVVKKIDAPSNL
ncbi:predicted protein [Scheffersomyces stipitis CBS 6054]|uniref:Glutaredoxin domain-containing protein n=1 Tax=Scheffersomyces stipitis (strain ATCC 58785 / CBS 6054 / NBRC 10063 / NRRL Y-11545) TaxID=322104 RepID=A3LR51_PICST|nr:predicted protein [Scheffersomyces stipitis CBS 6054]ABN65676.2 predicted protein [Scheffersomyces stipitis CBS 6054]KAG2733655.1 hypothetical protein G9P44_003180 [Scheffersomyces stipitis]